MTKLFCSEFFGRSMFLFAAVAVLASCANVSHGGEPTGNGAGGTGGTSSSVDAAPDSNNTDTRPAIVDVPPVDVPPPCLNLQCQQVVCPTGSPTTISGTTFAPNGTLPLYNVQVYVPNAPLPPFKDGISCDRCGGSSVRSVTSAVSNEQGKFQLTDAPVGKNIPLVVQVGKWRRQVMLPEVTACQDNPVSDPNLSRLPRNRQEGDMPRIAVTTGGCDNLACLLTKVGVDAAELGVDGQNRAVTYFQGAGDDFLFGRSSQPPNTTSATPLWRNETELSKYDMLLLSCECSEEQDGKGGPAYDAMTHYLAAGGRIFGSDFMYVWYRYSTDPMLAGAMTIKGGAPPGRDPMVIDTTFPKGKAMADWMMVVDPTVTYGQIDAEEVFDNITAAMMPTAQVWASSPGFASKAIHPRIITVNTPAGSTADQACGRAVHLDAHISSLADSFDDDNADLPFPQSCGTKLNKGEQALAFLFFDLSACIQDDTKPIAPPRIIP
ncbi:MAG TPA: hypothetical protein VH374_05610 [Polyangia bacterium]|nr:hypothetical protein [Polyangia bacterium]